MTVIRTTFKSNETFFDARLPPTVYTRQLIGFSEAVVDSRLRPRYANHVECSLVVIYEQNFVGISAVVLVVFYHRLGIDVTHHRAVM